MSPITATHEHPTVAGLPGPEVRPGADVVIYDGDCRFCQGQVRRLTGWDTRGRLAFLSLHDPRVARDYPDLSQEALMRDMYVVDQRGRRHRGAAAIRYLSRRLPRLWWIAPFLHIPGMLPVWQCLYRQVANRRYRLGQSETCENGACSLHRSP